METLYARLLRVRLPRCRCPEHGVKTIMERAVDRGLQRRETTPVVHLVIDEKSFGKGHDYITVLTDIDGSRADLVHDKFHVAKHLGEAVDQVRRAENKALQAQDDDRLKGVRCRLRPMVRVAKMLKRHLPNLLSYFHHRITNATSEGFNSGIQALKYAARGFRSFKNYRTRI